MNIIDNVDGEEHCLLWISGGAMKARRCDSHYYYHIWLDELVHYWQAANRQSVPVDVEYGEYGYNESQQSRLAAQLMWRTGDQHCSSHVFSGFKKTMLRTRKGRWIARGLQT